MPDALLPDDDVGAFSGMVFGFVALTISVIYLVLWVFVGVLSLLR